MKAVILCGGQGTRIRDVSEDLPKPMIKLGSKPIIWHIMKGYAAHNVTDFVLCLGYNGTKIKEFFLNFRIQASDVTVCLRDKPKVEIHGGFEEENWTVTLANTGEESLTGRRIGLIKDYVGKDDIFLLTYGDGVSDLDIGKTIAFHKEHGKAMTVTGVRPPGRFGELAFDDVGQVTEFNEKPQATEGWISGGFFVCSRKVFDYMGTDNVMLEEEPMRAIQAAGQLMVYRHEGFWQCMDTFRDYKLLNRLWETQPAPWKTW